MGLILDARKDLFISLVTESQGPLSQLQGTLTPDDPKVPELNELLGLCSTALSEPELESLEPLIIRLKAFHQ